MVLIQLILEGIALVESTLGHFVHWDTAPAVAQLADHEWVYTAGQLTVTAKGEYLSGAIADIVTYGAILVDWIVQALLGGDTTLINGLGP